MSTVHPALLLLPALLLAPACGHKGPPLPPRRHTPPNLVDFRLAQRGEALEMSCSAPTASVDGVAFREVDIELFWGEGWIDLEKEGQRRRLRAAPGSRVVETVALPGPGTLVRAAGRAVAGRNEGQRSLILALETHAPLAPPHDLTARLRQRGVGLNWRGPRPEALPPPDLGPVGGARLPFSTRPLPPTEETESGPTPSPGEEVATGEPPEDEAGDETGDVAEVLEGPEDQAGDEAEDAAEVLEGPEDEDPEPAERGHGFRVYRRLASSIYGVPLNFEPQERRLFTDTGAPLGATVCYVIRAVGSVEPLIESAASNEVCLEVRDVAPPAPPTGLAVVPRPGALEVVWSRSAEPDLGGYRIYRAEGGAEAEPVGEVPAGTTAWLDTTTQSGRLYRYTVTAFDEAGNEGPPSGTAQGRGP